jgi:hypothetical protein
MFNKTVSVKLKCPVHPKFEPSADFAKKSCRYCQNIVYVAQWLELAEKKAEMIDAGMYESSDAPDPEPEQAKMSDVADVAEAPATPVVQVQTDEQVEAEVKAQAQAVKDARRGKRKAQAAAPAVKPAKPVQYQTGSLL